MFNRLSMAHKLGGTAWSQFIQKSLWTVERQTSNHGSTRSEKTWILQSLLSSVQSDRPIAYPAYGD